jgi:hypothetical protein
MSYTENAIARIRLFKPCILSDKRRINYLQLFTLDLRGKLQMLKLNHRKIF